ncbi:WSC domain-containing protein [Pochonia chlamydosporia 170]|uniref:WSC domain-containing protein n=1 Tax=Pochonia chlamydosporia 170 TaxID=1380566 RepID=A0A179G0T0_METCM|nr:WSC domain-containing protein [Pochonia chlamydosporia 170]OAQ70933.1 WSC domain-containing protein [Pochonia chlamydosporia 170]
MARPGALGSNLADLASYLLTNGPRKVYPASRRVRVIHNHTIIVDTSKAMHVWEHDGYPQFYVPLSELRNCSKRDTQLIRSDGVARAAVVEVTIPSRNGIKEVKTDRVLRFTDDKSLGALAGLVRLEFGAMDQWLEEDVPVYVHPKDPFKRIDILPSSRPIEVKVGGKTVAKASSSVHLHETGLPARYYISPGAVDPAVIRKSSLITKCPYKGDAEYYHILVDGAVYDNLVWYYRLPTHESAGIAGLLCFYNEKVDILLDGQLLERPKTHFG